MATVGGHDAGGPDAIFVYGMRCAFSCSGLLPRLHASVLHAHRAIYFLDTQHYGTLLMDDNQLGRHVMLDQWTFSVYERVAFEGGQLRTLFGRVHTDAEKVEYPHSQEALRRIRVNYISGSDRDISKFLGTLSLSDTYLTRMRRRACRISGYSPLLSATVRICLEKGSKLLSFEQSSFIYTH